MEEEEEEEEKEEEEEEETCENQSLESENLYKVIQSFEAVCSKLHSTTRSQFMVHLPKFKTQNFFFHVFK